MSLISWTISDGFLLLLVILTLAILIQEKVSFQLFFVSLKQHYTFNSNSFFSLRFASKTIWDFSLNYIQYFLPSYTSQFKLLLFFKYISIFLPLECYYRPLWEVNTKWQYYICKSTFSLMKECIFKESW